MELPPTKYARYGDLHVAYQTLGSGPPDIVFVAPMYTNIEAVWEQPAMARYLRRLSQMGRLVLFDAIGTGLSDPLPELQHSLDSWATDVRVVMDAVGIERAVIHSFDSAGEMAMLFAAQYPQRVASLVLVNTFARLQWAEDFPLGLTDEQWKQYLAFWSANWGTGRVFALLGDIKANEAELAALGRFERHIASPGAALRYLDREWRTDVRETLPLISAPTLILHRADNTMAPAGHGRYLADRIAGAKYVELPGRAHLPYVGDADAVLDEIREFLTGVRAAPIVDRILATLLFTDIVDSTLTAARMGDRVWRDVLDAHDKAVRAAVARFDGRFVKATGDGALATFNSPGRAIAAARAIDQSIAALGLEVRAGIHTGECEMRGEDVGGIAVHIAARIAAMAQRRQLLVSRTVTDLVVGADIAFVDAGEHELKGVPGTFRLYAVG
jgi:class 3 adenylate cyclase